MFDRGSACPFSPVVNEDELCSYCGLDGGCLCCEGSSGEDEGETTGSFYVRDGPSTVFGPVYSMVPPLFRESF